MPSTIRYEVNAKRDKSMMEAYITFINRVRYPRVTTNFLIFGVLILFLPFTGSGHHPVIYGTCYVMGIFLILMGLFRHHIPIKRMEKRDPEYQQGIVTTYRFDEKGLKVLREEQPFLNPGGYHKISALYYDESFFYLCMNQDDLFILPKNCFTIGSADTFQQFILSRCNCTCRYIPRKLINKIRRNRK